MSTPASVAWCEQFPTSVSIADLAEPFMSNCGRFISALKGAGAGVSISATYRPPERAYLMHYACMIAMGKMDPAAVPPMAGVDIEWNLGSAAATMAASHEMVRGYGIAFPAALVSRHTQRLAIDMTISGFRLEGQALWDLGATFGVIKLPSDPPHWSSDGH